MAKSRADDPLYFIKVPTPDGYQQSYTWVPTDPLKLHLGVLTSLFAVDEKDSKKTRDRILKQVHGIDHVVRPYVDTTDISSNLRVDMQQLSLELVGDHGDVGERITALVNVFAQELPQLLDMVGQGAMDTAEKVAHALAQKIRTVSLDIASRLSVSEQTVAGMADAVQKAEDKLRSLDEVHLQIYRNWSNAVHTINDAIAKIQGLFQCLDQAIDEARKLRAQLDTLTNTYDDEFLSAVEYVQEQGGEFQIIALTYLSDTAAVPDILEHVARAQSSLDILQRKEQEIQKTWSAFKNKSILDTAATSTHLDTFKGYLEAGYINFSSLAKQLGPEAVKPYELNGSEIFCTQSEFESAEKCSRVPEWSAGKLDVLASQVPQATSSPVQQNDSGILQKIDEFQTELSALEQEQKNSTAWAEQKQRLQVDLKVA